MSELEWQDAAAEVEVEEQENRNNELAELPAPFAAGALAMMMGPARDKRTRLLAELTDLRGRIVALQKELDGAMKAEQQRQLQVMELDDWLDACRKLGTLSRTLELTPATPQPRVQGKRNMGENDFTAADCLAIFAADRNVSLTTAEVLSRVPAAKRVSAQTYLAQRVNYLLSQNKLERVTQGVYRWPRPLAEPLPRVVVAIHQAGTVALETVVAQAVKRGRGRPRGQAQEQAQTGDRKEQPPVVAETRAGVALAGRTAISQLAASAAIL